MTCSGSADGATVTHAAILLNYVSRLLAIEFEIFDANILCKSEKKGTLMQSRPQTLIYDVSV